MTKALITGITGQDGAYLAKELLAKGYEVVGTTRSEGLPNQWKLEWLGLSEKVRLICLDLSDRASVISLLKTEKPEYIYNFAAQSSVSSSFEEPHLTSMINYLGLLNILETIKLEGLDCNVYQASSSEMFGNCSTVIQNEESHFDPVSPYGVSKLAAYYLGRSYRLAYGINCSSGILFNHESELRSKSFVTRKITYSLALIREDSGPTMKLGNLDSARDWGYAPDYVRAMILVNESKLACDYVIATNTVNTVRDFFRASAQAAGFMPVFEGHGLDERCVCEKSSKVLCVVDKSHHRPLDINYSRGDYSKISKELGWHPTTSFEEMAVKMVTSDLALIKSRAGRNA